MYQPRSIKLPYEIVGDERDQKVILKGPRSRDIVVSDELERVTDVFELLTESAMWVYGSSRDAEARFTFLNYHLSLDWRVGSPWPSGMIAVLPACLVAAREAFAFHLQDKK